MLSAAQLGPLMTTNEYTAMCVNMSSGNVKGLAENGGCEGGESPASQSALQTMSSDCAKKVGSTQNAQTSIVSLRAALALQPAFISRDDDQPPATLPTSDSR